MTLSVTVLFVSVCYPRILLSQVGTIRGIVADSVYQTGLASANVVLEGGAKTALVASDGRFKIDSVPSGPHRLIVFHPLLDLIGINLVSTPISINPGETISVILATPSPSTLLRLKCGQDSEAGILGRAGSSPQNDGKREIRLTWIETIISRKSIQTTNREDVTTIDPDGSFKFCHLPRDLQAVVSMGDINSASRAADTINFRMSPLAIVDFSSASQQMNVSPHSTEADAAASGADRPSSGRVRGRIVDADSRAITGAIVTTSTGTNAETDSTGRFDVRSDKSGPQHLSIKKLGYAEMSVPVFVVANDAVEVTVEMSRSVPTLAPVTIRERYDAAERRIGFDTRRQRRPGSFFLGPTEMDRLVAVSSLPQLLSRAPNLRYVDGKIVGRPRGYTLHMTPIRTCVTYMVDGYPGRQDTVTPADIAAVEVYLTDDVPQDIAHFLNATLPPKGCETVFIWTRVYLGIR